MSDDFIPQLLFVEQGENNQSKFSTLTKPAQIFYYGMLYVTKHTPVLIAAPPCLPEHWDSDMADDYDGDYKGYCDEFYKDVNAEDAQIVQKSLNVSDVVFFTAARLADDYIDVKMDSCWRHIRIPSANVIFFSVNPHVQLPERTWSWFETLVQVKHVKD